MEFKSKLSFVSKTEHTLTFFLSFVLHTVKWFKGKTKNQFSIFIMYTFKINSSAIRAVCFIIFFVLIKATLTQSTVAVFLYQTIFWSNAKGSLNIVIISKITSFASLNKSFNFNAFKRTLTSFYYKVYTYPT